MVGKVPQRADAMRTSIGDDCGIDGEMSGSMLVGSVDSCRWYSTVRID